MIDAEYIERFQRWILVHSYLYYHLDTPIEPDYMFDHKSRKLETLTRHHPSIRSKTKYWYAMKDFDGSTGVGFFDELNEDDKQSIIDEANSLLTK